MNTLHIEDFVVLGRTVPEESRKYGTRICMAGYSPGINQFLRVYPLKVPVGESANANGFKARHAYALDLRRNDNDNRPESWRLVDENSPTTTPWDGAVEVSKEKVTKWLQTRAVGSIATLNWCKLSLGVLHIKGAHWRGEMVPRSDDKLTEEELTLFEDLKEQNIDASQISTIPYISFRDEQGTHRIQVREWGAYRLLVKPEYANSPDALWNAPGYRKDHDLLIVVGNMNNHRTNWLIIKTFESAEYDTPLFEGLP